MKIMFYTTIPSRLNLLNNLESKVFENIDIEQDFALLITRIQQKIYDVLLIDDITFNQAYPPMSIFCKSTNFYIPTVLILGTVKENPSFSAPSNYTYVSYENLNTYLLTNYLTITKRTINKISSLKYEEIIYAKLLNFGLKPSTTGTIYLERSIYHLLIDYCLPSKFNELISCKIVTEYNTSIDYFWSCMNSAIHHIWQKNENEQLLSTYFSHRPTAKEFIYRIAHDIKQNTSPIDNNLYHNV